MTSVMDWPCHGGSCRARIHSGKPSGLHVFKINSSQKFPLFLKLATFQMLSNLMSLGKMILVMANTQHPSYCRNFLLFCVAPSR